jgi:hypothetical protein
MTKLLIPRDALVLVGDGKRALFLRNAGDSTLPNLNAERVLTDANLPTYEQSSDRPGRVFKRAGTNMRSGVETTDWHELEKERFASGDDYARWLYYARFIRRINTTESHSVLAIHRGPICRNSSMRHKGRDSHCGKHASSSATKNEFAHS